MKNLSITTITRFIAISVISSFGASHALSQGAITGTVLDAAQKPSPNAVVYYNNIPQLAAMGGGYLGPVVRSTVTADARGRFTISGLPFGTYYVCAGGAQATALRSCDWDLPLATVTLSIGAPQGDLTATLGDGVRILMSLGDPNGAVIDRAGSGIQGLLSGNFKVGVSKGSWYAPATLISSTNGVRIYQVIVPKNTTFTVTMWTTLPISSGINQAAATGTVTHSVSTGTSDVTMELGAVQ